MSSIPAEALGRAAMVRAKRKIVSICLGEKLSDSPLCWPASSSRPSGWLFIAAAWSLLPPHTRALPVIPDPRHRPCAVSAGPSALIDETDPPSGSSAGRPHLNVAQSPSRHAICGDRDELNRPRASDEILDGTELSPERVSSCAGSSIQG